MRVLLADDELPVRTVVRLNMERRGWTVDAVEDGEQALHRATTTDGYDAIVLDQRMPGLTGIEVARRLEREVPVIIHSAYLDDDLERQAVELGCHTIGKADIAQLMGKIEELVDQVI